VENASEAILVAQDGWLKFVNRMAVELSGYSEQELLSRSFLEFVHPDDQGLVTELYQRRLGGDASQSKYAFRLMAPDGRIPWAEIAAVSIDWEGKPATLNFLTDITERRRAEEALRESENRYRRLVENASEAILVAQDGWLKFVNRMAVELSGYSEQELLSRSFLEFVHPDDRGLVMERYLRRLSGDASQPRYVFRLVAPGGRIPWVEIAAVLIDWEGKPATLNFLTDITDRRRAEAERAELEARNRQLEKAESLSRMAGAIAHHFNSELQAVLLNLELAKDDLLQDAGPAVRSVTEAMVAASRAADMSKLMLTYLGQTPGVRESLDLSIACSRWLSLLGVALPKHVVLETDLASPGPTIRANADQIRQVLTHLVTNAWEAGGAGRAEIRVTVKAVTSAAVPLAHRFPPDWQPLDPAFACLEVVDHGCGVAEADIEKLFDPFYSSKFTGRGLGLSIVLGIVRSHGGAATVESTQGSGSAFRVYLPVSD
jgi:two-component system cell cycle sensor histidine kinase/response regulator CckA